MLGRHPQAELAPRDVVSREIHRVLRERGERTVWLDATGIERHGGPGTLARRFPGVTRAVTEQGPGLGARSDSCSARGPLHDGWGGE